MSARRNTTLRISLAAATIAVPLLAFTSFVDAAPNGSRSGRASASASVDRHDPDNVRGISVFMETIISGNGKVVSRDFPGAIELYRKAIQLAPKNPLGHYVLAEVQLASGNVTEAQASAEQAEAASDDRDANLRGKILFLAATIKERWTVADHPNKWADVKTAWQTYADFAAKHGDAGTQPQSATARIQAVDEMMKQDKAYDVVRERISVEKAAAANSAKK